MLTYTPLSFLCTHAPHSIRSVCASLCHRSRLPARSHFGSARGSVAGPWQCSAPGHRQMSWRAALLATCPSTSSGSDADDGTGEARHASTTSHGDAAHAPTLSTAAHAPTQGGEAAEVAPAQDTPAAAGGIGGAPSDSPWQGGMCRGAKAVCGGKLNSTSAIAESTGASIYFLRHVLPFAAHTASSYQARREAWLGRALAKGGHPAHRRRRPWAPRPKGHHTPGPQGVGDDPNWLPGRVDLEASRRMPLTGVPGACQPWPGSAVQPWPLGRWRSSLGFWIRSLLMRRAAGPTGSGASLSFGFAPTTRLQRWLGIS